MSDPKPLPACPKCQASEKVIPIVYGKPGPVLMERADKGEIILGGCCITDDSPSYHCKTCDYSF